MLVDRHFVERRAEDLQVFLTRACSHMILHTSKVRLPYRMRTCCLTVIISLCIISGMPFCGTPKQLSPT